jgi:guanylate kinase
MSAGRVVVVTGPSGVGKGTLLRALLQCNPNLSLSVSATTRSPRVGEVEGQHYYFKTIEQFQGMIAGEELLEWAQFAGNFYGTPRQPVLDRVAEGAIVILEIELAGARQVRQSYPDAQQIFVMPPSVEALESRLRSRGQDPEESILRRLAQAKTEMAAVEEFDVCITNDDFDQALDRLIEVVAAPALVSGLTDRDCRHPETALSS